MNETLRGDLTREADRHYLAGLALQYGREVNCVDAWELLNAKRMNAARKLALDSGRSPEEAEAEAKAARIGIHAVRRDLAKIVGRVQEAGLAGAAVFLDDQISAVEDDIETTHRIELMVLEDLERSRREVRVIHRGERGDNGAVVPVAVIRNSRVTTSAGGEGPDSREAAAEAALYGRLQECLRRRQALRAELRALHFGRLHAPMPSALDEEGRTFAQVVMQLDDPAQAREAAMELYRRELVELEAAANLPLAGDVQRLALQRAQRAVTRVRALREYVRLPAETPGEHRSFEVVFEEVAAPAALGTGENGGGG